MTISDNSAILYAVAQRNRTHTPSTGFTERYDFTVGTGGNVAGIAGADQVYTTGGAKAISATISGNTDWAIAAVEIKEAAAAGGSFPPNSLALAGVGR